MSKKIQVHQLADTSDVCIYNIAASASDYTARVISHCDGITIPLENT